MTEAIELWKAWSSSANRRCLSCCIRKSGEGFFRPGESLLHTCSGGASGPDVFLKENTDDRSLRIVEGIVVKRKQALFELPHPHKWRKLFSTWGKFAAHRPRRRKRVRRIFEGEYG